MKNIKIEVWATGAVAAFLLSWLIDGLTGPVSMTIGNPVAFLSSPVLLNTYPFTATSIIIRTVAIFISLMLLASFIPQKYFTKAIFLTFIAMLGEFFAIQQLATGFHVTTIQWTLSIAYGSLVMTLGILWMILKGVWTLFNKEEAVNTVAEDKKESSVLEP